MVGPEQHAADAAWFPCPEFIRAPGSAPPPLPARAGKPHASGRGDFSRERKADGAKACRQAFIWRPRLGVGRGSSIFGREGGRTAWPA